MIRRESLVCLALWTGVVVGLAPATARAEETDLCPDQQTSAIVCIGWKYYLCDCPNIGIKEYIGGCPSNCYQTGTGRVETRNHACNIALGLAPTPPDCTSGCEQSGYEEDGVLFTVDDLKCCEGIKTRKYRPSPLCEQTMDK